MTDRELLELAAKAAAYKIAWEGGCETGWMAGGTWWNPLSDDGDALRLAVKLHLNVTHWRGSTTAERPWTHHVHAVEHWGPDDDHLAATRRAIVRAAAEIGKAMS